MELNKTQINTLEIFWRFDVPIPKDLMRRFYGVHYGKIISNMTLNRALRKLEKLGLIEEVVEKYPEGGSAVCYSVLVSKEEFYKEAGKDENNK